MHASGDDQIRTLRRFKCKVNSSWSLSAVWLMSQTIETALNVTQQNLRRLHLQNLSFVQHHDSAKITQILQDVCTILYGTACLYKYCDISIELRTDHSPVRSAGGGQWWSRCSRKTPHEWLPATARPSGRPARPSLHPSTTALAGVKWHVPGTTFVSVPHCRKRKLNDNP